ncbi:MAG: NAD-dependent epimerase [Cyclobacteriaceae bacterium]
MKVKKVIVTGAAGFIGFHLCKRLLEEGFVVVGIDSLNDYYDVQLKLDRLDQIRHEPNFTFAPINITDKPKLDELFKKFEFDYVINLAAQAGVRHSIDKPYEYIDSNLIGFINILEACRNNSVEHLIFASSSSVYGANKKVPFEESDHTDHPVSLYAATKKSNEMMAHAYSALYNIPCTGLRFFTVYGPWGRPDMAYFKFAKSIMNNEPIKVFNNGEMSRDFTYIDDIVQGISRLLSVVPRTARNEETGPQESFEAPYAICNIGNNSPVKLMDFISMLEKHIGVKAIKEFQPMQQGDVKETYASINKLNTLAGFSPSTSLDEGLEKFVAWFKSYNTLEASESIQR